MSLFVFGTVDTSRFPSFPDPSQPRSGTVGYVKTKPREGSRCSLTRFTHNVAYWFTKETRHLVTKETLEKKSPDLLVLSCCKRCIN